jgi:hypothetical protein
MAAYIDSLKSLGALSINQELQSFDPDLEDSRQLTRQMQKGKVFIGAFQDWVESILREGSKFIKEFTATYAEGRVLLGEIQTLTPHWEADRGRCQAVVYQINEVEQYGVTKFLTENPMKSVDPCMLFILKSTMSWKDTIYMEALREVQATEKRISEMHAEFLKDLSAINPTGIPSLVDGDTDSETLVKNFTEQIWKIRDTEASIASSFTTLANIESMLYLNQNVMPCEILKIKELKWQKDACREKLLSLKNPYAQAMQEFMTTFRSWKLVKQTVGVDEKAINGAREN